MKSRGNNSGLIKLAGKGNTVIKMANSGIQNSSSEVLDAQSEVPQGSAAQSTRGTNLFADDNVSSFFRFLFIPYSIFLNVSSRRPDFSPDGQILVTPTGIYKPFVSPQSDDPPRLTASFCCHVFSRNQLTFPIASLAGLEEPSVAIRFSTVVYKAIQHPTESIDLTSSLSKKFRLENLLTFNESSYSKH